MTTRDAVTALERFFLPSRLKRIDDVLAARCKSPVVVLDNIKNAHNVSAVMRSADAFGIQTVYCVGESYEFSRGISLGSERWLTIHLMTSRKAVIDELRSQGFKLVILQAQSESIEQERQAFSVSDLAFSERLALIFGNEVKGVSDDFLSASDFAAHIPMTGFVESLNISVAAATTFFMSTLKQRESLSEDERLTLKLRWLKEDLRGGEEILKELQARGLFEKVEESD